MKALLLAALLVGAIPVLAQTTRAGLETATPTKGATTIILHTADSASTAYAKVVRGLLAQGYGIDKSDKDALYIGTTSKPFKSVFGLVVHAYATSSKQGSDIAISGLFTWASSIAIAAHIDKKENGVRCMGGGNTPAQQAWNELQQAAVAILPTATVTYK